MSFKKLGLIVALICLNLLTCGWIKQKAFVYFNNKPFTAETVLKPVCEFDKGTKIYYLFFSKKRLKNDYIRVQLFKINDKVARGGAEMLRVKEYRLMKDEVYYQTDYFVLHQSGRFVVQIFDPENVNLPLAVGEFKVR